MTKGTNPELEIVQLFMLTTELIVNEAAPKAPLTVAGTTDLLRLECLERVLACADAWFRIFFSMPDTALLELPLAIFWQLHHNTAALFRLTVLDDPAWDRDAVRRTVDVFEMLERLAVNLEHVPGLTGRNADDEDDAVCESVRAIREMKGNWEAEVAAASQGRGAVADLPGFAGDEDAGMNFLNDPWLSDMFGGWTA